MGWARLVGVLLLVSVFAYSKEEPCVRIATFNVSIEGGNFSVQNQKPMLSAVIAALSTTDHPQLRNIAEIIQHVRPDILLLNEFDYIRPQSQGIDAFQRNYLNRPQRGAAAIDYAYRFVAPVNSGVDSGFDLNGNGQLGEADDAWGYGHYSGQYGMALLSRFPIRYGGVRTFRNFPWRAMPGALAPVVVDSGEPWYSREIWQRLPLSSKSHWDIPVDIGGEVIHVLAAHPTPPVFDGAEDRNGRRNHDEIRFWKDYIDSAADAYIYDDIGAKGGLNPDSETQKRFVILGDLNASPDEGDALPGAIGQLLTSAYVNSDFVPVSKGAAEHSPQNPLASSHTAEWGMRADYVLPSYAGLEVCSGGVFWPHSREPLAPLVTSRRQSSDHRLVWLDIRLKK